MQDQRQRAMGRKAEHCKTSNYNISEYNSVISILPIPIHFPVPNHNYVRQCYFLRLQKPKRYAVLFVRFKMRRRHVACCVPVVKTRGRTILGAGSVVQKYQWTDVHDCVRVPM